MAECVEHVRIEFPEDLKKAMKLFAGESFWIAKIAEKKDGTEYIGVAMNTSFAHPGFFEWGDLMLIKKNPDPTLKDLVISRVCEIPNTPEWKISECIKGVEEKK